VATRARCDAALNRVRASLSKFLEFEANARPTVLGGGFVKGLELGLSRE
jgi:hypothetical protein